MSYKLAKIGILVKICFYFNSISFIKRDKVKLSAALKLLFSFFTASSLNKT